MFQNPSQMHEISDILILSNLPDIYKLQDGEIEICKGFNQLNKVGFMVKLQMLERLLYYSLTQCFELLRLNPNQMNFYFMDLQDFIAVSSTKPEAINIQNNVIVLADKTFCKLLKYDQNDDQQKKIISAIYGSQINDISIERILFDHNLLKDLDLIKLKTENNQKQYEEEWDKKHN